MILLSLYLLACPQVIRAQDPGSRAFDRGTIITAALEIMDTARYCALISLDSSGHPQARTMDPFLPGEDMVVWMGTNVRSRKVGEIRRDPRVSLYYEDPYEGGYVVIKGKGYIVNDPEMTGKYWKMEWDQFYPDKGSSFTLIKVVPEILEIVSYRNGISSSTLTWEVPRIEF